MEACFKQCATQDAFVQCLADGRFSTPYVDALAGARDAGVDEFTSCERTFVVWQDYDDLIKFAAL